MKLFIFFFFFLLFSSAALAMQSPESADRDRCFHQYKDNPAGMYDDSICVTLADRYQANFPDLQYLIGCAYQLDGQAEKAAKYFSRVEGVEPKYSRKTADRLYDPYASCEE